jgi:hypothetical protein
VAIDFKPYKAFPSIPAISGDTENHTVVLSAMREAVETHERRTGNVLDSFVRVRELVELGIVNVDGSSGIVTPPSGPTDAHTHPIDGCGIVVKKCSNSSLITREIAVVGGAEAGEATYAVFTEDDTWEVPEGVTSVDVLLVGGGGGAGNNGSGPNTGGSGGGGGGGVRVVENMSVTPAAMIAVVVGDGGVDGTVTGTPATDGEDSSFGAESVTGGGAGQMYIGFGAEDVSPVDGGADGGSGGGAAGRGAAAESDDIVRPGGDGDNGSGSDGGSTTTSIAGGTKGGGGGGGASAPGGSVPAGVSVGGVGGNGVTLADLGWSDAVTAGAPAAVGGGGGGQTITAIAVAAGGVGGGGDGEGVDAGGVVDGENGTPNTGGGAGGKGANTSFGHGGSGLVVVRWPSQAGGVSRLTVVHELGQDDDPTLDLREVEQGSGGQLRAILIDLWGRVVSNRAVIASDIPQLAIAQIDGLQIALDNAAAATEVVDFEQGASDTVYTSLTRYGEEGSSTTLYGVGVADFDGGSSL